MASACGHKKSGSCLLRLRRTCPMRRLRRCRCYDIQSATACDIEEHWTPPGSNCDQPGGQASPNGRSAARPDPSCAPVAQQSRPPQSCSSATGASSDVDPETGERAHG